MENRVWRRREAGKSRALPGSGWGARELKSLSGRPQAGNLWAPPQPTALFPSAGWRTEA